MVKNRSVTAGGNRTKMTGAGGNQCTVTCTRIQTFAPTSSDGVSRGYFTIDPLNSNICTVPVTGIAGAYEFYRLVSTEVKFVPAGGDQQVGSVSCAYVTNPEMMVSYINGTNTLRDSIVFNEQGVMTFPLNTGGTKRFSGDRTRARRWNTTDFAQVPINTEVFDRSVAAMLALNVYTGTPNAAVAGRIMFTSTFELKGLGVAASATLLQSLAEDEYSVYYNSEEPFPGKVIMRKRDGNYQRYNKVVLKPDPLD